MAQFEKKRRALLHPSQCESSKPQGGNRAPSSPVTRQSNYKCDKQWISVYNCAVGERRRSFPKHTGCRVRECGCVFREHWSEWHDYGKRSRVMKQTEKETNKQQHRADRNRNRQTDRNRSFQSTVHVFSCKPSNEALFLQL